jgi:cell division protein FtsL
VNCGSFFEKHMKKHLLLREYFILIVVTGLMAVSVLSSVITSHKVRQVFLELQQKKEN